MIAMLMIGILIGIALDQLASSVGDRRSPGTPPRPQALPPVLARPRPSGVRLVGAPGRPYDWAEDREAPCA